MQFGSQRADSIYFDYKTVTLAFSPPLQCNEETALELFNTETLLNQTEEEVAVIGYGCSLATEAVAGASNIPVVSHAGCYFIAQ